MLKLSDPALWIAVGLLIVIGLLAIVSCTYSMQVKLGGDPFYYLKHQIFSLFIGIIGLVFFAYLDYKHLKSGSIFLYLLMVALLGIVMLYGATAQGAQRWFQLGPYSFQPSEIAKIIMVITLAAFFSGKKKIGSLNVFSLFLIVGIPFFLIFTQPDLGTSLVLVAIFVGMLAAAWSPSRVTFLVVTPLLSVLLRANTNLYIWIGYIAAVAIILYFWKASFWEWVLILGLNIVAGLAMPYVWGMLKEYQRQRILTFLNPASDPKGAGYHSLQSLIAVGSGGVFGKGFMQGSQTQLQFIPEQHSDFVFSVVAEEFGFMGAILVLSLFGIVIWRALAIASSGGDSFASLLALGIAVMTGFHIFANIGMTLGLLPVVGMPLPFMSYGGSSLVTNMILVGLLLNVRYRWQEY